MTALIIVHGIGNAEPGTTMRKVVRSAIRLAADAGLDASLVKAEHNANPPTARLKVGDDEVDVIEASWDELVPSPTFSSTALWLLVVTPFTAIGLVRAIPRRWRELRGVVSTSTSVAWLAGAVVVRVGLGGILFPLWFLPLLVAVAGSALLPGALAKATLGRLQRTVSATLGDSFVFVDDPVARATILERVRGLCQQAASDHDHVVVVGHSQGAHIAMAAIGALEAPAHAKVQLFTWGSGFRKLGHLEKVTRNQPASAVQAAVPVFGLPAFGIAIAWADGAWSLIGFGVLALLLLGWWITGIGRNYQLTAADIERALPSAVRWTNIWSTHDPVCDGGLRAAHHTSVCVANTGTTFGDHTRYHHNPHVMAPLLSAISPSFRKREAAQTQPASVRTEWYRLANLLGIVIALSVVTRYLLTGFWSALGLLVLVTPWLVWSRLELSWRLRRRHQSVAAKPTNLAERWISDSTDPSSYNRLVLPMVVAVLLTALFNVPGPAALTERNGFRISSGWGNGAPLATSTVFYLATVAAYLGARIIANRRSV